MSEAIRESLRSDHGIASQTDLVNMEKRIMASQTEIVTRLNAASDRLDKIGTETATLLQMVADLKALVAAGGNASPELVAAVEKIEGQAQKVDDLVPDTSVPPVV